MKITVSEELLKRAESYSVVYQAATADSNGYLRIVHDLAEALSATAVCENECEATECELLIGATARPESAAALLQLKQATSGFAICVFEKKIAIVGTSSLLTLLGVQYFKQHYLNETALPACTVAQDVELLTLADRERSFASYVYGAQLYDKPYHPIPELVHTYRNWEMRDYPCVLVDTLIKQMAELTGLDADGFAIVKDDAPVTGKEVVIGISSRPAARAALTAINGGEYAVCVGEQGAVITGWNYASLELAYDLFADLIKLAASEGAGKLALPAGLCFVASANPAWITEFPKPQGKGIALYNTLDTNDSSLQFLYTGEGIGRESFLAYCEQLQKAGYALVMENEIEQSVFKTFVNRQKGVMLYAAYEAYAHQYEYAPRFMPAFRIVTSPLSAVAVPDAGVITPAPAYKKVTNTAVTNIEVTGRATGMGYIVTLEDGSFIVFDGGGLNPEPKEPDTIWRLLNILYQGIYNEKPTPENPIRVAAWVITHSHWDHYGAFRVFIDRYGKSELFSMKYLIGNYPSRSSVYGIVNEDILNMGNPAVMQRLHDGMREDFTFLKVHAGQKYYFANLEMEVLMTYDNISPARIYNQNDTSTVLRFKLQASDKDGAHVGEPYTMMWLGDANNNESRFLCGMYGSYVKSDMTSVAHHGNIGCENDLYNTINAETVWFPHYLSGMRMYLNPEKRSKSWVYDVDQTLIHDNPHTKYVYCSGGYTRIDPNTIQPWGLHLTLPFGEDGRPAHGEIYDTIRGKEHKVPYTTDTVACGVAMRVEHK